MLSSSSNSTPIRANSSSPERNGEDKKERSGSSPSVDFSPAEMKFYQKFGLSEQEELIACWDCRLDLYVPRNGKLFLSRHSTRGGHICFSSCKSNKSNVKRCIPLVEVVHMEKKEATITNLKYYGVRGIAYHFSDGTMLQFSRFLDRDGVWDLIREEWERSRNLITGSPLLSQKFQEEDAHSRKERKKKKKKKEVVCTNPPLKKKKKKKQEFVLSPSSCGLFIFSILEARGLPRTYMSNVGFVEPRCTLSFGTQVFQTEKSRRNRGTCRWNEKFNIAVYSWEEATLLDLLVQDDEDRVIGTYSAPIADFLVPSDTIDRWIDLETQQTKGFYFDENCPFQIHTRSQFKSKEEIQQIFWKECVAVFDGDGDNKVDFSDALKMFNVLGCTLPEDEIHELYQVIDVNNDGAICADDLVRFTASGSGGLIALLVRRCPLCGYHLSTTEEEVIYHLGICVFDDVSSFKTLLVRMMAAPLGSVIKISKKMKKTKKAPAFLVMDRKTGKLIPEIIPQRVRVIMKTVYGNKLGKKVVLTNRATRLLERVTINQGLKLDHPSSVNSIETFIYYYKINTEELNDPIESFKCFNEFFYRKLADGARPIASPEVPTIVVSAADARLMVFNNVSEATRMWIKGRNFSLENLLDDEQLAATFEGGSIAVFRLAPQDYHRFHMPVDGKIGPSKLCAGNYHTVNPLAINSPSLNVFTENARVITMIDSPEFGPVAYIAIGATLVGSIILTCHEGDVLKRGDEIGYFAFGGSTIIVLFGKGAVKFSDDLLLNSKQPVETLIRMGEEIGRKRTPEDTDDEHAIEESFYELHDFDEGFPISEINGDPLLIDPLDDPLMETIRERSTSPPLNEQHQKRSFKTKTMNTFLLGTKLIPNPKKLKPKRSKSKSGSQIASETSPSESMPSSPPQSHRLFGHFISPDKPANGHSKAKKGSHHNVSGNHPFQQSSEQLSVSPPTRRASPLNLNTSNDPHSVSSHIPHSLNGHEPQAENGSQSSHETATSNLMPILSSISDLDPQLDTRPTLPTSSEPAPAPRLSSPRPIKPRAISPLLRPPVPRTASPQDDIDPFSSALNLSEPPHPSPLPLGVVTGIQDKQHVTEEQEFEQNDFIVYNYEKILQAKRKKKTKLSVVANIDAVTTSSLVESIINTQLATIRQRREEEEEYEEREAEEEKYRENERFRARKKEMKQSQPLSGRAHYGDGEDEDEAPIRTQPKPNSNISTNSRYSNGEKHARARARAGVAGTTKNNTNNAGKRIDQIYPPPNHPYLYQMAPYVIDIDDCFSEEFDELDESIFEETENELSSPAKHFHAEDSAMVN